MSGFSSMISDGRTSENWWNIMPIIFNADLDFWKEKGMTLGGDFSLVSLFWARHQMCLNWKCGKSCGHRFHASWLSKLWILEVSETEPSGTSSSPEVTFTINLAVRSTYAFRPDPLPFRDIQKQHKLADFIFLGRYFTRILGKMRGVGDFLLSFFSHPGTPRWFFPPNITDEYSFPTGSVAESCGVELEEVKAQTAKEVDLEQDGV